MTQHLTAKPNPATQGGTVQVCYDTTTVDLPLTLTIDFDPDPDDEQTITANDVPPASFCFDISVPGDCEGITIVDKSGQSDDYAITVNPS